MKTLLLILATLTPSISFAQVVLSKVEGTFSAFGPGFGSTPDFPSGVTGYFAYTLNVPQTGLFGVGPVAPDVLTLNPAQWGATTFSRTDVGLDLTFNNGILQSVLLGGLFETEGGISFGAGSLTQPSDFMLILNPGNNPFGLFFYQIDGQRGDITTNFQWSLSVTPVGATAVPEPSSFGMGGVIFSLVGVLIRLRRRRV